MKHDNQHPEQTMPKATSKPRKRKPLKSVTEELTKEIVRLHELDFSVRKIGENPLHRAGNPRPSHRHCPTIQ